MKNLLKVKDCIVNLDQLNYAEQDQNFLYLYFEGKSRVEFEGEEAKAVWAELESRSDKTSLEPPEFDVRTVG